MKITFALSFLFLSTFSSSLELPESSLRKFEDDGLRDLGLINGDTRCERQLSMCEVATGKLNIPGDEWVDFIGKVKGDDEFMGELEAIVERGSKVDYTPLVESVSSASVGQRLGALISILRTVIIELRSIRSQLDEPDTSAELVSDAVYSVYDLVDQTIGGLPDPGLDDLILIINFIIDLIPAINSGPVAVFTLILETVIEYLNSVSINLLSLTVFPKTDPECMSELMFCDYTKMMLTAVPALFGATFLANGLKAQQEAEEAATKELPEEVAAEVIP